MKISSLTYTKISVISLMDDHQCGYIIKLETKPLDFSLPFNFSFKTPWKFISCFIFLKFKLYHAFQCKLLMPWQHGVTPYEPKGGAQGL
jgi:hypothetical protein